MPEARLSPREIKPSFFPWKAFSRFFSIQIVTIVLAVTTSGLAGRHFYKKYFFEQVRSQLGVALDIAEGQMPASITAEWCSSFARSENLRLDVFSLQGNWICSSAPVTSTETPSEVILALENGSGEKLQAGYPAKEEYFSLARKAKKSPVVIRAGVPLIRFTQTVAIWDTSLGLFLIFLVLVFVGLAFFTARSMVFPLGRLLLKTKRLLDSQPEVFSLAELRSEVPGEWLELESNLEQLRKRFLTSSESLAMEKVELDALMAAISDAVLAVDKEGAPLFFNSRFQILFGNGLLNRPNTRLWEIIRNPEVLEAFTSSLREEKMVSTRVFSFEPKIGARRYLALSVSPLRRHTGVIYGALGIFHDVTELKSAEQMRIDFVANVSHELRTPLTAIKGYAETVVTDMEQGTAPPKEYLQTILRNSQRLMTLVEDLLDLSTIESNEILQKESLSTREITARILKQLAPQFERKFHHVATEFGAETVVADVSRLEQVLTNLLDNAGKYTPDRGEIKIEWKAERDGSLLIISDSGTGIAVEHQARLFERFYRVDKARSRELGGTGLGLAIVKHIMQRHDGGIWVESEPGKGARFFCRFPDKGESA